MSAAMSTPITVSLGVWQIDRAEETKEIPANSDKLLTAEPTALQKSRDYQNCRPIKTTGVFIDPVIFEVKTILNGRACFKLYQLFENADRALIVVHIVFYVRNMI